MKSVWRGGTLGDGKSGRLSLYLLIIAVYLTGMCPTDMTDILARRSRPGNLDIHCIGRYYRCTGRLCIGTRAQHKELQFRTETLFMHN